MTILVETIRYLIFRTNEKVSIKDISDLTFINFLIFT